MFSLNFYKEKYFISNHWTISFVGKLSICLALLLRVDLLYQPHSLNIQNKIEPLKVNCKKKEYLYVVFPFACKICWGFIPFLNVYCLFDPNWGRISFFRSIATPSRRRGNNWMFISPQSFVISFSYSLA